MGFTQAELALLEAADRTLSKPDKRKRAGRYKRTGNPMGAPRQPIVGPQRAEIQSRLNAGESYRSISKTTGIRWQRLKREFPKETTK